MISEASAAISSIKAAIDIAKGVSSLKNTTEINQAVIDIQRALLDAQLAAFNDRELIAKLQKQISELEIVLANEADWENEKARYSLTEVPTGALVYALKDGCSNGEPQHSICVKCFNENRKSVHQVLAKRAGGLVVQCQHCNTTTTIRDFPEVDVTPRNSYW